MIQGKEDKEQDKKRRKKKNSSDLFYTPQAKRQLMMVALKCLCELLVAHPNFNFRTNIIALVVPFACRFNPEVRRSI